MLFRSCSVSDVPSAATTISALETATGLTFSDNCTAHNDLKVTSSDGALTGTCTKSLVRTYTVTDKCGNSVEVNQTISVKDETAPILATDKTWPSNIVGQDNCLANADISGLKSDEYIKSLFTDCNTVVVSLEDQTTGNDCGWTVTRTYIVKDVCGNTYEEDGKLPVQSVSGSNQTVPTISLATGRQSTYELGCNPTATELTAPTVDYFVVSDVCDNTAKVTLSAAVNGGATCAPTRSWTASYANSCGTSAESKTITYSWKADTEKPVLSVKSKTEPSACNPTEIVAPVFQGSDNCDGDISDKISMTTNGVEGSGCAKSQTWKANYTDGCNNKADEVVVTYTWTEDKAKPVISTELVSADKGCNWDKSDAPKVSEFHIDRVL